MDNVQDRRGRGDQGHAQGLRVLRAWATTFLRQLWHRTLYTNDKILPGIIDVQSATYDNPDAVPARAHIQVAEGIGWMERAHELPKFERYPPQQLARSLGRRRQRFLCSVCPHRHLGTFALG